GTSSGRGRTIIERTEASGRRRWGPITTTAPKSGRRVLPFSADRANSRSATQRAGYDAFVPRTYSVAEVATEAACPEERIRWMTGIGLIGPDEEGRFTRGAVLAGQ